MESLTNQLEELLESVRELKRGQIEVNERLEEIITDLTNRP